VKYMLNLVEGVYLIKFLVDGQFKCSPDLQIAPDSYGNNNNILEIVIDDLDQPSIKRSILDNQSDLSYKLKMLEDKRSNKSS